jgi:flagellar basal-body rod modification protein FlgD
MNLLVTQLRNQNPLEPMDNQDMSAQLAQFSELQQLEDMNSSFGNVLESIQRGYASSLIGKNVSFLAEGAGDTTDSLSGAVEEIVMGDDIELIIGDRHVSLADVLSVRE